ncbi:MAG TPA: membrane protein insertase YidC [Rhizomicrobium sp.]|jgi:YidC/Oxa1 family membrane protein insertase|nr:membrane protein insertase YidC [Rhizomicrobium sp.]
MNNKPGINNNMLLTLALMALVVVGWQYFVVRPEMKTEQAHQAALAHQEKTQPQLAAPAANVPGMAPSSTHMGRDAALKAEGARVAIDSPLLDGSIALKGAKFDDLRLKKYRETTNPKSPEIVLLAPKSTSYPYYAEFGWVGAAGTPNNAMPNDQSIWQQQGSGVLSPGHPVTLTWDNGHGLVFTRVISVDDQYMFNIADSVTNNSASAQTLYPFAYVAREGVPKEPTSYVLHQGFVGVANGSETDANYSDFKDAGTPAKTFSSTGGWVGITDKYWMAALVPPQNQNFDASYLGTTIAGDVKAYQANYRLPARAIAPGGTAQVSHRLFAGAKVVDILRGYEKSQGIARFDNAIDWGWFWFLTQPLFWLLDIFYKFIGNFGLAILMLTVVVKILFFPLANASFKSMSKMKKVQPHMEEIRKVHKDDPQRQQKEMMEMYKREKVNPLAGCVPMLIQIPVFFSLYKVLYVTIEMRQAPFYGWIHDLSAPDPTSILNLFGLLPYHIPLWVPAYLSIGIWPILMGFTQFVQTKLNPAPTDPVQAKMFTFMPLIFTFMFATFPAGLVIYYTWNNLLSVTQQYVIMRREGVKVHLFENLKFGKAT